MKHPDEILKERQLGQIVISETTKLPKEPKDDVWAILAEHYRANRKHPQYIKAVTSILNAILTHKRVHFVLTRESTTELLKNDKNHRANKAAFDFHDYPSILGTLQDAGYLTITYKEPKGSWAFELIEPTMLAHLSNVDAEQQKAETLLFVKKDKSEPSITKRAEPATPAQPKTESKGSFVKKATTPTPKAPPAPKAKLTEAEQDAADNRLIDHIHDLGNKMLNMALNEEARAAAEKEYNKLMAVNPLQHKFPELAIPYIKPTNVWFSEAERVVFSKVTPNGVDVLFSFLRANNPTPAYQQTFFDMEYISKYKNYHDFVNSIYRKIMKQLTPNRQELLDEMKVWADLIHDFLENDYAYCATWAAEGTAKLAELRAVAKTFDPTSQAYAQHEAKFHATADYYSYPTRRLADKNKPVEVVYTAPKLVPAVMEELSLNPFSYPEAMESI